MDPKINTGGQAFPGFDEDGKAVLGQTLRADIAKHMMAAEANRQDSSTEPAELADWAVKCADALIERLER